jgi:Fe-S-cluster containining protein
MRSCADCGACCVDVLPLVTSGDMYRLSVLDPMPVAGWVEARGVYVPEDDPNLRVWNQLSYRDGCRYVLVSGGACQLLGPNGCRASLEQRPLICRIYPWDFNDYGLLTRSDHCPGYDDTPRHDAEVWVRRLYAELLDDVGLRGGGHE